MSAHCFAADLLKMNIRNLFLKRKSFYTEMFYFTDGSFFTFTKHEPVGVCGAIIPVYINTRLNILKEQLPS